MKTRILILATVLSSAIATTAWAAPKQRSGMDEHFKIADTNGDGVISKEEHLKSAEEQFTKMDTNGDGKLTVEERKASAEAQRAARMQQRKKGAR